MFLAAQVFGFLIAYYDITTTIANFFVAVSPNWIIFMGLVFILLTITGMFMEVGATNVILLPPAGSGCRSIWNRPDPLRYGLCVPTGAWTGDSPLRVHYVHRLRHQRRAGRRSDPTPAAFCPG